jgi:hypothetical protein
VERLGKLSENDAKAVPKGAIPGFCAPGGARGGPSWATGIAI